VEDPFDFQALRTQQPGHHATHGAVPLDQAITLALRYTRGGAVSTR